MIENLLLQQVLLYTREHSNPLHYSNSHRSRLTTAGNSLLIQPKNKSSDTHDNEHLVLMSSRDNHTHDDEPTLCLIESNQEYSSNLIEEILNQYNQQRDNSTRFDQNLMDLIVKRNHERKHISTSQNNGFRFRLQWLAIGLIIDRFFFYMYFAATLVSYFVTLWLIPFSHPNLIIDIQSL
jgi:hypothetical protein